MALTRSQFIKLGAAATTAVIAGGRRAKAADAKHYSFGYDQPHTTGYGIGADIFAAKLAELSKGTMVIDQFPGAQLGQEPQMLQKIRTGDIDFMFIASANAATLSPQSGVLSIHFLFRSEDASGEGASPTPALVDAMRAMFADTVKDAHCLTLLTLACATSTARKRSTAIADIKNVKIRVQATPTEDTMFPAYGAQTVHMPFGAVYTSLQTGVVDMAENGINVYDSNKHYEVAPIMSMTGARGEQQPALGQRQDVERLSPSRRAGCDAAATRSPQRNRPRPSSWSTSRAPSWRRWA